MSGPDARSGSSRNSGRARTLAIYASTRSAARVSASALQALTLLLLGRFLGADLLSHFVVAYSLTLLAGVVASCGVGTRILRVLAEKDPDRATVAMTLLRLVAVIPAATTGVLVASVVFPSVAAWAGVVGGVADHFMDYAQAKFAGHARHGASVATLITQRAVPAMMIGVIALGAPASATILTGYVVVAIVGMSLVRLSRPDWRDAWSLARTSSGYWMSTIVGNTNQLEPAVLSASAGTAIAGPYAVVLRLIGPLTVPISALQMVFVPELSRLNDTERRNKIFRSYIWLSVGYAAILIVLSPVIVTLVLVILGSDFEMFRPLLFSIVAAGALSAMSQALQSRLLALGAPGRATFAVAAGYVADLAALVAVPLLIGVESLWLAPLAWQGTTLICMLAVSASARKAPSVGASTD